MKNILLALLAAMGLLATSCSKDEPTEPTDPAPTPVEYQQVLKAVFGIVEQATGDVPATVYLLVYTDPYSPNGTTLKTYNAIVTTDPQQQLLFEVGSFNMVTQEYEYEYKEQGYVNSTDCVTGDGNFAPAHSDVQQLSIKPVVGEFTISFKMDFLDSGNKPFRYFKTPAYVLKMWQESGEWKATLTQK